MDRRQFLINVFKVGGIGALVAMGVPHKEIDAIAGIIQGRRDGAAGKTINSVTIRAHAKESGGAGNEFIGMYLRMSSTNYVGTTYPGDLTTSYSTFTDTWTTNPQDSQSWEESDLANIDQFGVVLDNIGASEIARLTATEIEVSYEDGGTQTQTRVPTGNGYLLNFTSGGYADVDEGVSGNDGDTTYCENDAGGTQYGFFTFTAFSI